jgi:acyl-CoA synthetase (NDP forming)
MTVESTSSVAVGRAAGIGAMLRPRSIALLGASARKVASGNEVLANLLRHGYDGELHLVHPRADEIQGVGAVPTVKDLPPDLDARWSRCRPRRWYRRLRS